MKRKRKVHHLAARVLLASLLVASLTATSTANLRVTKAERVGMSTERLARIEPFFKEEYTDQNKLGSVITLVARHGKIVHLGMSGYKDIASGTPVSEDDLFRIFSMSKPITGVALMMLYEEGKFQLTDPLSKYIPEFSDLKVFVGQDGTGQMILENPKRQPTIHDLMRHTAGFVYGPYGNTPVHKAYREAQVVGCEL